MRILRVMLLLVILLIVLSGAVGFLYVETRAKHDISAWLSDTLNTKADVTNVSLTWPPGLDLYGVNLNDTAVVKKASIKSSPENVKNLAVQWAKKRDVLTLPVLLSWDGFHVTAFRKESDKEELSQALKTMADVMQNNGRFDVVVSLNRQEMSLKRLEFAGDVILPDTSP